MPFNNYSTGTVAVANGATTIVGSGTIWSTTNARAGDDITIAGNTVIIQDVTDTSNIVIDPWPFTTVAAGTAYKITQRSPLRYAGGTAMNDVQTLVSALNADGFYVFVASNLTVPDPSIGNNGQYAFQPSTNKLWVKTSGAWSLIGIIGNLFFNTSPYSSGTTYSRYTIISYSGKLYLSVIDSNIGHQPDISPSQWQLVLSGGDAYDVVTFDTDRPASGELVLKVVFTHQVVFISGLATSKSTAEVASAGNVFYSYRKNGTEFARLTFNVSATGVFSSSADSTFNVGDVLTVFAPASRDATLSGVGATLSGTRS